MTDLRGKIREIIKEIEAEKGPLYFAALVERENVPGRLDLVVVAPWIDSRLEFYEYISPKLHRSLTREEWGEFSRTAAVDTTDDFFLDFKRQFDPVTKEQNVRNLRLGPVDIRYAHIFPTHASNGTVAQVT